MKKTILLVTCIVFIMGLFLVSCQKQEPSVDAGGEKAPAAGYGEKAKTPGYGEKAPGYGEKAPGYGEKKAQ